MSYNHSARATGPCWKTQIPISGKVLIAIRKTSKLRVETIITARRHPVKNTHEMLRMKVRYFVRIVGLYLSQSFGHSLQFWFPLVTTPHQLCSS